MTHSEQNYETLMQIKDTRINAIIHTAYALKSFLKINEINNKDDDLKLCLINSLINQSLKLNQTLNHLTNNMRSISEASDEELHHSFTNEYSQYIEEVGETQNNL